MAEIQGKDIVLSISTVTTPGSEVWKELICLETLDVNWTKALTKRQTRCGTKIGLGVLEIVVSGTSIADDAPGGSQISHKDMEGFMNNGTLLAFKVAHATTSKYYVAGTGYVSSLSETAPSDNTLDFTFQLDMTGTVDLTP